LILIQGNAVKTFSPKFYISVVKTQVPSIYIHHCHQEVKQTLWSTLTETGSGTGKATFSILVLILLKPHKSRTKTWSFHPCNSLCCPCCAHQQI